MDNWHSSGVDKPLVSFTAKLPALVYLCSFSQKNITITRATSLMCSVSVNGHLSLCQRLVQGFAPVSRDPNKDERLKLKMNGWIGQHIQATEETCFCGVWKSWVKSRSVVLFGAHSTHAAWVSPTICTIYSIQAFQWTTAALKWPSMHNTRDLNLGNLPQLVLTCGLFCNM